MRKFKALGLAMVAVFAVSTVITSAAEAQFTASSATWATATSAPGNEVFTTEGGDVECAAHFSGKLATSTTTVTITASYFECEAFGFAEATVINGCDWSFYSTGHTDLECPGTNKLVVMAGSCEIQIGSQTGLKTISLASESEGISARVWISLFKYNVVKDGAGCPFGGTGQKTDGQYSQSSAVSFQSTSGASISVDNENTPLPPGTFTANAYPTTVTATSAIGNSLIVIDGSSIECAAHYEGRLTEGSAPLRVVPEYTACKAFGTSATVSLNGCAYVLSKVEVGEFNVECPPGKHIVSVAGNCEVQIGPQSGLKSVSLVNNGNHVDVRFNVSNLTVNVTKDGFLCPLSGTGHRSVTYKQGTSMTLKPVGGGTSISID